MPAKYLQVDGTALYVVHDGPTTLPGRPPAVGDTGAVLALHDAGRHGWDFSHVREALGEVVSAPNLIGFDQPGHGRSGELDSLGDVGRLADLVRATNTKLELTRPVLLGHGLGGAVALRFALDTPDDVAGVVVLGCGATLPVDDDAYALMQRVTEGKARRPFDVGVFAEGTPQDVMRPYFMEGMKTDPRATFGDMTAARAFDETERVGELGVPLLVVVGEYERADVRAAAEALASAAPNATLEVVDGAAHALPVEASAAVATLLRGFMEGLA